MVETSVAVATPSTTAARITNGSASAGNAIANSFRFWRHGVRGTPLRSSPRLRHPTTVHRIRPSTSAGSRPPVNSAAIDTPVTEPMVISTRLGGTVSVCAPVAASSASSSPSSAPRAFISGNSAGATAAMSAAFAPEMPDTRYIAPTSTYDRPPRTCPSRPARKATIARAMPVASSNWPRNTNSGTASRIRCDMPSSMRPAITSIGVLVPSAR